jgi:hypothetical protein
VKTFFFLVILFVSAGVNVFGPCGNALTLLGFRCRGDVPMHSKQFWGFYTWVGFPFSRFYFLKQVRAVHFAPARGADGFALAFVHFRVASFAGVFHSFFFPFGAIKTPFSGLPLKVSKTLILH